MKTKDEFIPILGKLNIVLAEDDETDCLLFKDALEELPLSAQLTIVHDGEQLLNLLRKPETQLPDVIFLDLNMPKKNGFVALVAIKNDTQLQQIPIIIFSATNEHHVDKIKIEQVFKDAAHHYIRKPSNFSELKKVIYKALAIISEKDTPLPTQEHFLLINETDIEKNYTESILNSIDMPLLILNRNIKVKTANKAFYKAFNLDAQEIEGVFIGDLDNKQWNISELIDFLRRIIPDKYVLNNFEMSYNSPTIGKLTLFVSAKEMISNNFEKLILLSIDNITKQNHQDTSTKDIAHFKKSDLQTPIEICTEQRAVLETELAEIKLKLTQTNEQILLQTKEGEKWAAELIVANKELIFQNIEKEKRAAELIVANKELIFQSAEKEKRAAELLIADKELIYQSLEKEKRAADLIIAVKELIYQNEEKEKRAAELIVANKEFIFQSEEKEKRAAELGIANNELVFQNEEKEKRAAELGIANNELIFQNKEKEKRAAELGIANNELVFQNKEKEKRAAELIIANKELVFQNEEKEKRATELISINKELEAFAYISSHDLQEPLRKIQMFSGIILENEKDKLSEKGKSYFHVIEDAANRMQTLIEDLLTFSRLSKDARIFEITNLESIIEKIKIELKEVIDAKHAVIEVKETCKVNIISFQFHQLLHNLIGNALKFANPKFAPHISIKSSIVDNAILKNPKLIANKTYCHITVTDNGIGFEPIYSEKIFEVFQKLHGKEEYSGTGIGLAIVKKIVENHNGIITATGELNQGATFNIYIPNN